MTFQNEAGRNVSLRLRYPKGTLTNQEVKTLMDTIIQKNIFASTGGDLVGKVSAVIQDNAVQTFDLS
ncbi:MAG: DUF2922 domain-containing protein [Candidatus Atribacteria bacterium]|nr:DUF2922 domain-containing protein [Candidatus Atribacteria bacterium]